MKRSKEFPGEIAPEEKEAQEIEAEASVDTGTTERRKVKIPQDMDPETIQREFKVSRTTAWRAKQRGWLFFNYRERVVVIDNQWADVHVEQLRQSATEGSRIALATMARDSSRIKPFEFNDLVSEAYVRLMELSGHPDRDNKYWRNTVARNAALDFIKTQIIAAGRVVGGEDYERTKSENSGESN